MSEESLVASTLLSPLSGRGDWIPDTFKEVFRLSKGGVDFATCVVFSKILYWHTLSKKGSKKFFGKAVYLSISDLSKQTGATYDQTKRAIGELERTHNLIKRRLAGKRTYITLNVDMIYKTFELHQGSSPDKVLVHRGSSPSESGYTRAGAPAHIHKEKHKQQFRIEKVKSVDPDKKERLEEQVETLKHRISDKLMSEEHFTETCRVTSDLVASRLTHGDTIENILDGFLTNAIMSINQYPAFARVSYIVNNLGGAMAEADMKEIIYKLKTECTAMPEILQYLNKYCPEFDQSVLNLDQQLLYDKSFEEYCSVFDELAPLEEQLKDLENEE